MAKTSIFRNQSGAKDPTGGRASVNADKHPSESEEQIAVIEWAAWHEKRYPGLELLHHIPNGGLRNRITAARLKREGVKPGIPDLHLPVGKHGYHGLYIEMKSMVGSLTKAQTETIEMLRKQGYYAIDCKGADAAISLLKWYMKGEDTVCQEPKQ